MTVKSVIEIDVLDEKFKAFSASFEKYKKSVEDHSKKWKEVNKALEEAEKRQKAFNKSIQDGGVALKNAVSVTASIASNMASAALSAAKWLTYAALGGGFGLGGLAGSASNLRREATGLGVNSSQLRAARTYGEPYLGGIEGVMSNIQRLQTTLTEQYKVGILGGNLNKNAFQNLPDVLTKARQAMKDAGGNIDVARAMTPGLQDVLSEEQLQTVGNMKPEEFATLINSLRTGSNRMNLDDADYEAWRKFWVQLKESGNVIEESLLRNLKTLTPQLTTLSRVIADTINDILKSKEFGELMDTVNQGIKDFGKYLTSGEAKDDMKTFLDALKLLSRSIVDVAEFFGLIPDKSLKNQPSGMNWFNDAKNNNWAGTSKDGQQAIGFNARINSSLDSYNPSSILKGVNSKLAASIQMAGLDPISGYRTEAQQKVLYDAWIAGGKRGNLVAKPGESTHQFGEGADVSMASLRNFLSKHTEEELNQQYNLKRPYGAKDPNHVELYNPNRTDIYVHFDGQASKANAMSGKQ